MKSTEHKCECPKPCKQTIYEPGLSQAALSVLSVDNILSANMEELMNKYHYALDARQRVEQTFVSDLQLIKDIQRYYIDLRRFTKTYLGDYEKSNFAKIWSASETLVNIFRSDINELMVSVPDHIQAYKTFYAKHVKSLQVYLQDLDKTLSELDEVLSEEKGSTYGQPLLLEIQKQAYVRITLAHANFKKFLLMINRTSSHEVSDPGKAQLVQFLPLRYTISEKQCNQGMIKLMGDLEDMKLALNDLGAELNIVPGITPSNRFSTRTPNRRGDDMEETAVELARNVLRLIKQYLRKSNNIEKCLTEYGDSLGKISEWIESAKDLANEYAPEGDSSPRSGTVFNYTEEVQIIKSDEIEVQHLLHDYSFAKISRLEMLKHFNPEGRSSKVLSHINVFVNKILSRVTEPLRERIESIRTELQIHYKNAFKRAAHLERYIGDHAFYNKAGKMVIWKIPMPNLDSPERHLDMSREYWKVWNREVFINEFVNKHAEKYIAEGLDAFCLPLLKIMDGFEEQLLDNKLKLLTALSKINSVEAGFIKLRKIDHAFVL